MWIIPAKRNGAKRGHFSEKLSLKLIEDSGDIERELLNVKYVIVLIYMLFFTAPSQAAVNLDRTRIIYDAAKPSVSLTITNDDRSRPFLAQAWVEDASGKKSSDMLVTIPPVQRIEPGASSLVRITATQAASRLPRDKETLFYFNLRGIPPRAESGNVLQIALQTRIKLFYRPAALRVRPGSVIPNKLTLRHISDGYEIINSGPYYITVVSIKNQDQPDIDMAPLMIAPGSDARFTTQRLTRPVLTYINDYGGRNDVYFKCGSERCDAETR